MTSIDTQVNRPVSTIGSLRWRDPAVVEGRVRSICVQPRAGVATLEATVWDDTGGVTVVWLGRRSVKGIRPGARVRMEGVVADHHGRLAFLNPITELLPAH